jgi:aminopeptidase N
VYGRGALTLEALRLAVGDDAFFKTLQTYASRFRDRNATTDDFIAVAQEVSGKDLKPLFQAWLYDEPLPALTP